MIFRSPAIRLSLALVLLMINLLFLAHQIGFIPDASESSLALRKALSESLALQFSAAAEKGEYQTIQDTLRIVVERNESIRSAAIRTHDGQLIALVGEHLLNWNLGAGEESTPTHVRVPLFKGDLKWATVEIRYSPLWSDNQIFSFTQSFVGLILLVGIGCFIGYYFILKRTLRELDPTAVIPDRVRKAFDVLQEGVLILDAKEQIVMANSAFAALAGVEPETLTGRKGSELGWLNCQDPKQRDQLPWLRAFHTNKDQHSASLALLNKTGSQIKLAVNVALVTDKAGKHRGCLVTFDDISLLEEKNFELNDLVEQLKLSNQEIEGKSRELEFLANRDPLTLCLNRRSLERNFKHLFSTAKANDTNLSCVMADIDLFKSVNDRFGHATGDQVIKAVAEVLKSCIRDNDLLGRYGGEEFCVVLAGVDQAQAEKIAERMRLLIEKKQCANVEITASLGVSSLAQQASTPENLINQADKALYLAKEGGRNRVVAWGADADSLPPAADTHPESEDEASSPVKAVSHQSPEARIQELEDLLKKQSLEIAHYEMYDAHTGLPTRSLFEDRIAHEIARSQRRDGLVVVLSMTIDTINRIEETLGHKAANELAKACGIRLNAVLREDIDMVAVIGDSQQITSVSMINPTEFGILLPDIKQVDHVTWVMKRLLDAFEKPFEMKGQTIYPTAYMGVAFFPYDGKSVEALCSSATNACRHAVQKGGRTRYLFASQRLNKNAIKQLQIENCLRDALDNQELQLHFQPQVEAVSGRVVKFEALLRWQNRHLGFVPPDTFIPVAEQTGLIDPIGDWVFYQALKQLRQWLDKGFSVESVAVNLSGTQLRQQHLARRIQKHLQTFELQPHQLEIELTESSLVDAYDSSHAVLQKIKRLGVQVAMDDFGTGYSSLAYLRDLPLSCLKIDRSFIAEIGKHKNAERLIASIISMAHELELTVVAEGIEEESQASFLTRLGCEYLQGYYFGRPMPGEAIIDKLSAVRTVSPAA